MTTAPDTAQEQFLYGPNGQRLTGAPTPARAIVRPTGSGDWHAVTTQGSATVWEKPRTTSATLPAPTQPAEVVVPAQQASVRTIEEQRPAAYPAQPAPAKEERTFFDRIGPWVALYAAIGLTASGEYALAHLVGFPGFIAALLPLAVDVYVIQAFRRHRDVAAALILMVATNALFHLADAHLFGVTPPNPVTGETGYRATWWLIVAVSAIGPFIVWRVHRITETQPATAPAAVSVPAAATASEGVSGDCNATVSPVAAQPVSGPATPRETVPATPNSARETATATQHETAVAATETVPGQRETARATRRETPRRQSTAKPAATAPAAIQLLPRAEQLAIVEGFVKRHTGDGDIPLQPIADALGCSKATASRRLAAYRDSA